MPKKQEELMKAVDENDIEKVKASLLDMSKEDRGNALWLAAQRGYFEIAKLLLPLKNKGTDHQNALCAAAFIGHVDIFKLLLPVSTVSSGRGSTLSNAAAGGNLEIFKTLLPLSDPKADDFDTLVAAARNGHLSIVKLLLPFGHPKDSRDLLLAAMNNHFSVIDNLYPRDNTEEVISMAEERKCGGEPGVLYLKKLWQADKTKTFLSDRISRDNKRPVPSKKM